MVTGNKIQQVPAADQAERSGRNIRYFLEQLVQAEKGLFTLLPPVGRVTTLQRSNQVRHIDFGMPPHQDAYRGGRNGTAVQYAGVRYILQIVPDPLKSLARDC